ncbi:hypothetical protein N9N03_02060, partial [Chlamydiia bacterium]|nr:hypothetical protein [Chlamydiia bacterium]MDA8773895.1 hypothetical protein [Chlamydiia bacterium]
DSIEIQHTSEDGYALQIGKILADGVMLSAKTGIDDFSASNLEFDVDIEFAKQLLLKVQLNKENKFSLLWKNDF